MNRTRLLIAAPAEKAWALVDRLEESGAESVAVCPLEVNATPGEPEPGTTLLAGAVRVEALYIERVTAEAAAHRVATLGSPRIEPCPERDWVAAGRAGFVPRRYGERLWVVPEWCEAPVPEAVNVVVAPGLAFGTGEHPSTALCLEWLASAELDGKAVIDYGAGSGVLAVAAAKLGAVRVFAVDTDPQALAATRANATRNDAAVAVSPPEMLSARNADVLIANILARPLIALAAEFHARVRRGGRIVLAGITTTQADVVAAAYAPQARPVGTAQLADWVRLELVRSAG
ncbi:MAG: 50S ribosomal protein L11 methyltransferase [Gammaproteobacteria bacterium]